MPKANEVNNDKIIFKAFFILLFKRKESTKLWITTKSISFNFLATFFRFFPQEKPQIKHQFYSRGDFLRHCLLN